MQHMGLHKGPDSFKAAIEIDRRNDRLERIGKFILKSIDSHESLATSKPQV
jgi:hypothetical protein